MVKLMSATDSSKITIRRIDDFAEMREVEELQKEVWGVPDLDVVPLTHLVAAREAGGVLIGAFDGKTMVGFIYGFPSFEQGQPAHHSHMLAVKPAFRNHDLGRQLKLAQREQVQAQGIGLMSWTFDPLQSLNAHFNFNKLGVISDRYLPNFYGDDAPSFLHRTGTDRLWVFWFLASERVKQRISRATEPVDLEPGTPLVQVQADDSPERNDSATGWSYDVAKIEIPTNINVLQQQRPDIAVRWREETRWAFTEALRLGYTVTEFVRETRGAQRIGKYLLSKTAILND